MSNDPIEEETVYRVQGNGEDTYIPEKQLTMDEILPKMLNETLFSTEVDDVLMSTLETQGLARFLQYWVKLDRKHALNIVPKIMVKCRRHIVAAREKAKLFNIPENEIEYTGLNVWLTKVLKKVMSLKVIQNTPQIKAKEWDKVQAQLFAREMKKMEIAYLQSLPRLPEKKPWEPQAVPTVLSSYNPNDKDNKKWRKKEK